MTKKLGSKLADSVRQAKVKQPQTNTPNTQQDSKPVKQESERPLPPLIARRVWPD